VTPAVRAVPRGPLGSGLSARTPRLRRAAVGFAWTLAWTLAWGGAILGFSHKVHAEPLGAAVSQGPMAQERGFAVRPPA
jgi:hypothetical protein